MAETTLDQGSTSLADANWGDNSGFATDTAQLAIVNSTAIIDDGLSQGDETLDYLHVRGGAPRFAGLLTIAFDENSVTAPSFSWQVGPGGSVQVAFAGSFPCPIGFSNGGSVRVESGQVENYWNHISGDLSFGAAMTFGASAQLIVRGDRCTIDASGSGDVLPVLRALGGTTTCRRTATTIRIGPGATVIYDGPAAPTLVENNGGTYRPLRNPGTTYDQHAGTVDRDAVRVASAFGTSNIYGGPLVADTALLDFGTINDFGAKGIQTGPPLT